MKVLRLYSPSLVCVLWASLSAFGIHGDGMRAVGFTVLAVTFYLSERERRRRREC